MTATNPFEAYADAHAPRPVRARQQRRVTREPRTARGKRLDERSRLAAHFRREEARRVAEALASPRGRQLADLLAGFDHLAIDDADLMITTVATQDWLLRADVDFRYLALRLIDARIARIRRDAGLPELDDPLPGEPDNAFLILKRMLRVT